MKKIEEMITKTCETTEGKCVDVYAYVKDDECGEVTLGYELCGSDKKAVMCYGRIDPDDPGDVPSRTFESAKEAAESEYGEAFELMFDVADKMR